MNKNPKIAIGGDHAGFDLKEKLKSFFEDDKVEFEDFGTFSRESVDYPDYVHPLAEKVEQEDFDFGILICGSANGVAMTANKHQDIRAAVCWSDEISKLARQHNNANIICIPARYVEDDLALKMVKSFVTTPFEGGRHERRVTKISL